MKTKTPKRVYLAGKVKSTKWEIAKYIDKELATFYASDGSKHTEHLWGGGYNDLSTYGELIMRDCALDAIEESNMLVAYLDTPTSYGSIAEIAWASAHKIPCYILAVPGAWPKSHISMYDAYWFISNFPNVIGMWVSDVIEASVVVDNVLKLESPIETKFYEAAMLADPFLATCLSAQQSVTTPDFTYRVDFMLAYGDVSVAIELDGHDSHKTVEQRTHDARKDRYMSSKGITVLRYTGTEVWRNPISCVREIGKLIDKYRPQSEDENYIEYTEEGDSLILNGQGA